VRAGNELITTIKIVGTMARNAAQPILSDRSQSLRHMHSEAKPIYFNRLWTCQDERATWLDGNVEAYNQKVELTKADISVASHAPFLDLGGEDPLRVWNANPSTTSIAWNALATINQESRAGFN